jgi:hypothetical protein
MPGHIHRALLLAGFVAFAMPAVAMENGTNGKTPSLPWAIPVGDEELAGMRGGFGGLAFSVAFTGSIENVCDVQGSLAASPGATHQAAPPSFTTAGGQVNIQTSIGDFQGAGGIFQITQVPGSFNVVNNNLFVQIAIVNLASASTMPSLATLFSMPRP